MISYFAHYLFFILISIYSVSCASSRRATDTITLTEQTGEQKKEKKRCVIDKTTLTIHGPLETVYICKSEIERPTIDGRPQNPEEKILNELIYQDAQRLKVSPPQDAEEYIEGIKKQNGFTDPMIDQLFKNTGRTRAEGCQELAKASTCNYMVELKISNRLFISQKEVEEYYNNHPLYMDAEYEMQSAFFPTHGKEEEQKKSIVQRIQQNALESFPWRPSFWAQEEDLTEEIQDKVLAMNVGDIHGPLAVNGGFEVFRLTNKKEKILIPLEKRFKTIVAFLRKPRFEQLLAEYHEELQKQAAIVHHP